jgi:hypothetical protein
MGMRDKECIFADGQTLAAAGDAASTNEYDSGVAGGEDSADIGLARQLWLTAAITTPASAGVLTPVLQHSTDKSTWADALVGPDASATVLAKSGVLWQTPLPVGLNRYLRVVWRVTTVPTGGKFTAYLTTGIQRNIARHSGFDVK